ncbi:MAG: hypothetical protein KDB00_15150 [Planctomycetales bacterium]|nr:hypothetical protein [Planctomycetales bacterium]
MLSFEQLIDEYYLRLRDYTARMLRQYPTVKRWEDTDDIVQLSLTRLIQAIGRPLCSLNCTFDVSLVSKFVAC